MLSGHLPIGGGLAVFHNVHTNKILIAHASLDVKCTATGILALLTDTQILLLPWSENEIHLPSQIQLCMQLLGARSKS